MNKMTLLYQRETYLIRGACFELYKELGCGHKEVVYQRGLEVKLHSKQLAVDREVRVPIMVNNKKVGAYVPDFVVENRVMLELKAMQCLTEQAYNQFWQYLRITPYKLGLLINFGKFGGVEIIRRVYESARH